MFCGSLRHFAYYYASAVLHSIIKYFVFLVGKLTNLRRLFCAIVTHTGFNVRNVRRGYEYPACLCCSRYISSVCIIRNLRYFLNLSSVHTTRVHGPCPGRVHGPCTACERGCHFLTRASFWAPVFPGREHGRWTRVMCTELYVRKVHVHYFAAR